MTMNIDFGNNTWQIQTESQLLSILNKRDSKGGAEFWLYFLGEFPCLSIRVSGNICHIIYLINDSHPGFRLFGDQDLPNGGMTRFVWEGADPGCGEDHPNEFVVSLQKGLEVAIEFYRTESVPELEKWFEL